jgi:hypothetical protein
MFRKMFVVPLVLTLAVSAVRQPATAQDVGAPASYTPQQIDNLVGPIALYPDALLAQVLVASTFPDQIDDAVRYVRANGTNGIDAQPWDVSVKAVAHYPTTLNMMADKLDWTTALGQAYAGQSSDVMASVQHLRAMANSQGNLVSTPQQTVAVNNGNYAITPTQTRVIYVPVYDPVVIYTRPVYFARGFGGYWSFGVGFPIGAWLSYDCDWRGRRVFYQGWRDDDWYGDAWYDNGWRRRSRPYVQITNIYVNSRFVNVYVNHDVVHRTVDFRNVERYNSLHRDVHFTGRENDNFGRGRENNSRDRNATARDRNNSLPDRNPTARSRAPDRSMPAEPVPNRPRPDMRQPAPVETAPSSHTFGRPDGRTDPTATDRRGDASGAQSAPQPPPRNAQERPREAGPRQAPEVARPMPVPAPARSARRVDETDGKDHQKKP